MKSIRLFTYFTSIIWLIKLIKVVKLNKMGENLFVGKMKVLNMGKKRLWVVVGIGRD